MKLPNFSNEFAEFKNDYYPSFSYKGSFIENDRSVAVEMRFISCI